MLQDLQHSFCIDCSPASSEPTKALWDNQVKSIVEMCFFNKNPLRSLKIQASVTCPRACCLHTGRPQTGLFCQSHHKAVSKTSPAASQLFQMSQISLTGKQLFPPPGHIFAFFQVKYHLMILFPRFQSLDRCIPRTGRNAGRIEVSIT